MNSPLSRNVEVLIVGAGPTGLVLALWLARLGVGVRIIDKTVEPGTTSRALAVQARTLEFYNQIGLANAVVERGRQISTANLWVRGNRAARAVFGALGAGISPFPYALVFPQDEHERLLIERLAELGVHVERQAELLSFEALSDHVVVHLKLPDGELCVTQVAYLAGCDGAHSAVRQGLQIGFPGGSYTHLFYVADVQGGGPALNGDIHVSLEKTDFLAVFPLQGEGRARLVGTVRGQVSREHDELDWGNVSKGVIASMRIAVDRVNWFSTYRVHHRVADQFRKGRVFLLGDAAHIHSPVGGQGMNTGIGDAVNLAWKLADVLHGHADESLLDSYEPERIAFARRLVATTDRAFTAVTSPSLFARLIRLDLVPTLFPVLFRFKTARKFLFQTVSQTAVNYRGSPLSEGRTGTVHGGDRLPWVKTIIDGEENDNFAVLTSVGWQVHVYGQPNPDTRAVCARRNLPLHVFSWCSETNAAGLQQNATYLVRPDGYVAFTSAAHDATAFTSYLNTRKLLPEKQG